MTLIFLFENSCLFIYFQSIIIFLIKFIYVPESWAIDFLGLWLKCIVFVVMSLMCKLFITRLSSKALFSIFKI